MWHARRHVPSMAMMWAGTPRSNVTRGSSLESSFFDTLIVPDALAAVALEEANCPACAGVKDALNHLDEGCACRAPPLEILSLRLDLPPGLFVCHLHSPESPLGHISTQVHYWFPHLGKKW